MHGVNQYDYAARYYDPAVPRFTTVDPLAEKYYWESPYVYVANNPLRFIDPTGMDWWSTNNKDEIENVLTMLKSGETVDFNSFGSDWTRVNEEAFADGIGIFDDVSSNFTINGIPYKDFKGFGKNIGSDYWASIFGIGLEGFGGTASIFLQQSADKNKFLRQSYYSTAYSARDMSTKISLSKIRINLRSLGKTLGGAAFAYTIFDSAIDISTGNKTLTDATFNIGLGAISLKYSVFGIGYGAVELLHPRGWKGWRENMNELYKYADESVMFGPKL